VGSDDVVTLFIHKGEMGQGTVTSLSMLLAEELECDWKKIRTEFPGVSRECGFQGVVGSASIRSSWDSLRKAGATAREMLIAAAARKWSVDPSQCRAENNTVINTATGERVAYGALAEAASKIAPPPEVKLKDPAQFRVIGKPLKRIDTPAKVDGSATFGLDVRRPGMLYAVVARCPVFGGKVASFDDSKAKAVPGVKKILQISSGVAVVADNTWSAMEGRRALAVQFNEGANGSLTSAEISRQFAERMDKPGAVARKDGDAPAMLAAAAKKIEAVYEVPFLAHAPMEPLNCVAEVGADSCQVWASTQMQTPARDLAAKVSGIAPEKTQVHTEYMGGGFGRRGGVDYIGETVEVAKEMGVPVKLTWSREDDLQHDMYRPASMTHFAGALDAEGWPVALTSRIACPPFGGIRDGLSRTGVEGVSSMPYAIPHVLSGGLPCRRSRNSGELLEVGGLFAERFLHGIVPRRAGRGGRKEPSGASSAPAGEAAAPQGRAGTGGR
jgi:isoquinoline 1-oxidoreductase beta subunit